MSTNSTTEPATERFLFPKKSSKRSIEYDEAKKKVMARPRTPLPYLDVDNAGVLSLVQTFSASQRGEEIDPDDLGDSTCDDEESKHMIYLSQSESDEDDDESVRSYSSSCIGCSPPPSPPRLFKDEQCAGCMADSPSQLKHDCLLPPDRFKGCAGIVSSGAKEVEPEFPGSAPLAKASARHRNWVFTLNNYTTDCVLRLENGNAKQYKYLLYGFEVAPSTGTPHLQGLIVFKDSVTFKRAKQLIGGDTHSPWLAPCKSITASMAYCKKGGDYRECGEYSLEVFVLRHVAGFRELDDHGERLLQFTFE